MPQIKTTLLALVIATAALTLVLSPSLASIAFAKPPKTTTTTTSTTSSSTSHPNAGLKKTIATTTTTTTTTTCANHGGQGPQAANCPGHHASSTTSTSTSTTCGVSNKPGHGSPSGPNPC
ncbi:MAG: hypothetical protein M3P08_10210 [Thermoproteota archaeon]|nr:hypothetical protein [Thermoproteota archaeon]